jgi:23S rRNA-intervening sequence protein
MFNFEKLDVWTEAVAFADLIYSVSRSFPDDDRFGLTAQMRRAVVRSHQILPKAAPESRGRIALDLLRSRPDHYFKSCRKQLLASARDLSAKVIMPLSMRQRRNRANAKRSAEIAGYVASTLNSAKNPQLPQGPQPRTLNNPTENVHRVDFAYQADY